ncbi:TPA: 30S ribosomal protein S14 [Candidatus Woesearchaeota archaeon]|nr:30S ribosomal protein S14 [Candidatus Woesearchaeota archaeon]HII68288.1 30S ribosomal protein S14 [Candidatus Woesearchaeota archaeon]
MTHASHEKIAKQLQSKPIKEKKFRKHSSPKKRLGTASKRCRRCGRPRAVIGSYGLNLCRQCFREIAKDIGFKKYS